MKQKVPIILIVGPTGVGKTEISLEIALALNTEIINADSRQIYKLMDIGTAKPPKALQSKVKHHLIDIIYPDEYFSAGEYGRRAREVILSLRERGMIPLIIGGSGLYIKALIYGFFKGPEADQEMREFFMEYADKNGESSLYERLRKVDPDAAKRIHPKDTMRIVRALEVYEKTGKPISILQDNFAMKNSPYRPIMIGLFREKKNLYKRIDKRVDLMIDQGLIDEVKGLLDMGYSEGLNSMMGIGYKQIIGFLKGEYDLNSAIAILKRDSRRYAKRQMTWFRKAEGIEWIDVTDNLDDNVRKILALIHEKIKAKN